MSSVLAAMIVAGIVGPIHIACVTGAFILRDAPAYVVRVPAGVIGSMSLKTLAFALQMWLLIDPYNCPCAVVPFMMWVDWTANLWYVAKGCFLLFRYEIQAALERSKEESKVVAFDETNFFVRYRSILRSRTQKWLMLFIFLWFALGNLIILGAYFNDFALQPCTYSVFVDNNITLGSLLFAWLNAGPLMVVGTWTSYRLKKFPNDNWQMGLENGILSLFTTIGAIACMTVLIVVPTFDGILWVLTGGAIAGQVMQFVIPLTLHRYTLAQLSKIDLATFATLDTLLLNDDFLDAFGNFLVKEFSSENLFFWLEVNRLRGQYGGVLPDSDKSVEDISSEEAEVLKQAALECRILGSRCVGSSAPWQLNLSGFAVQEMENALATLHKLLNDDSMEGLPGAVRDALRSLTVVQGDVYEMLRKDPYPRFLLTTEASQLNQNDHFKRMIATEKLEDEVNKTLGHRRSTVEGSRNSKSSKHSEGSKKSSKKDDKKKKRSSKMLVYLNSPSHGGFTQSEGVEIDVRVAAFEMQSFHTVVSSSSNEISVLSELSDRRPSDFGLDSPRFTGHTRSD